MALFSVLLSCVILVALGIVNDSVRRQRARFDALHSTLSLIHTELAKITQDYITRTNAVTYDYTNQTGIIQSQAQRIQELEQHLAKTTPQLERLQEISAVASILRTETTEYVDGTGRTRKRKPTEKTLAALTALVE